MHASPVRRRWRNALAATAVAAIAVIGFSAPASAAPIIPDPAPEGSITVHKRLNPIGDLENASGLENPAAPGTPLAGIEFQVQLIDGVDLRTVAGWQTAGDYADDVSTIPAGDLGAPEVGTTAGAGGSFTFDDLEIGAYLVTENLTPAQVADGITPAPPFVVTVPITHPTDLDTWVYDVHVYPKNLQTTTQKTVVDGPNTTYDVGDLIDWTVSAPVPAQESDSYAFYDALVEHLEIPAPTADNIAVAIAGTALAADDYEFDYDTTDNALTVTLTDEGLDKLAAQAGTGAEIALTLTTEIVSLPANGRLVNEAAVFPNSGFGTPGTDPGVPTNEVESKFGEINILKVDAATDAPLDDVEFKVFASEADARTYAANPGANAGLALQAQQNGTGPLTTTFVTAADGTVSITGLRASNWQNGAIVTNPANFQNYWVLETKAHEGYELATAPFGPVSVLFDADEPGVLPFGDLEVPNVPKVQLPLTGGTIATWVFSLTGALILTGSALLLVRRRRAAQS